LFDSYPGSSKSFLASDAASAIDLESKPSSAATCSAAAKARSSSPSSSTP